MSIWICQKRNLFSYPFPKAAPLSLLNKPEIRCSALSLLYLFYLVYPKALTVLTSNDLLNPFTLLPHCHCPLSHQSQPYHLIGAPAEPPDIHLHTQDGLWEMHIPPSDSPAGKFSGFLPCKGTGKILNTDFKAHSIYIYCLTLTFLLPVLRTMLPGASKVVHLLFSLPRVQFPHPFPPRDSYSVFRSLNNLVFPPTMRKKNHYYMLL